jgi:hypothetical protein
MSVFTAPSSICCLPFAAADGGLRPGDTRQTRRTNGGLVALAPVRLPDLVEQAKEMIAKLVEDAMVCQILNLPKRLLRSGLVSRPRIRFLGRQPGTATRPSPARGPPPAARFPPRPRASATWLPRDPLSCWHGASPGNRAHRTRPALPSTPGAKLCVTHLRERGGAPRD